MVETEFFLKTRFLPRALLGRTYAVTGIAALGGDQGSE